MNQNRNQRHLFRLYHISVPTFWLPMDDSDGGVLHGCISGVIWGGATIISGKVGSALSLNGNNQYVDYGFHLDKCYHNPDMCRDGVTYSMWLNMHAYNGVILNSGATFSAGFGYYILVTSGREIKISVKTTTMYYQYMAPDFPLNEWVHVVFTWSLSNTGLIHLYINGCDADATNGYAYNMARFVSLTLTGKFQLGTGSFNDVFLFADADIDELIFWNQVLQPLEVSQLYIFGGDLWIKSVHIESTYIMLLICKKKIVIKSLWHTNLY